MCRRGLHLLLVVAILSAGACAFMVSTGNVRQALLDHARRHPAATADDYYKLLHQAIHGTEHALRHREQAWRRLSAEWAALGPPRRGERLCDDLIAGRARVNLRVQKAMGGTLEEVFRAHRFLATRKYTLAAFFPEALAVLKGLARRGRVPIPVETLNRRLDELAGQGYPAVHHSGAYRTAYEPAYLLVDRLEYGRCHWRL